MIWVANGGKPIPPAAMERLFQPFFRCEVRASQGLGLHIASEIAKAHGGTLTVNSSEAETRFIFRMPSHKSDFCTGAVRLGCMTKMKNTSERATELVKGLFAEQAYKVGASVGSLLKGGMPTDRALNATVTVAEFIRRGRAAQEAVDVIIAAHASHKS